MPAVGPGVREIRIRVDGAHRVFYVATLTVSTDALFGMRRRRVVSSSGRNVRVLPRVANTPADECQSALNAPFGRDYLEEK